MARGNSKGIRRDKLVTDAIDLMKGEPFTASDIMDIIKTLTTRAPSVREIGMVLSKKKRLEEIRYIGEVGTTGNREMLEAAGLTQSGVRKSGLYIVGPPLSEDEVISNNRDSVKQAREEKSNQIIKDLTGEEE